jgi:hypothetical protein
MNPENAQPEPVHPTESTQPEPVQPQTVGAGPIPTAAPAAPRFPRPLLFALIAVVALVLIGGGTAAVLRGNNVGPFKDSGLAACEAIRADKKQIAKKDGEKFTEADYQKLRKVFSDSRYADIRDSGTKFTDLIWQFQGMDSKSDGALGMALAAVGQLMQTYSSLSGACANHGVVIPPLSTK